MSGKKPIERKTENALEALYHNAPVPAGAFIPPAARGSLKVKMFGSKRPSVDKQVMRIEQETDPVGMVMAIAAGQPVATHVYDPQTGEINTTFETLNLDNKHRQAAIKYLADKVLPNITQRQKITAKDDNGDTTSWEATIQHAASRSDQESD